MTCRPLFFFAFGIREPISWHPYDSNFLYIIITTSSTTYFPKTIFSIMTGAQDIEPSRLAAHVSHSLSISPTHPFMSPPLNSAGMLSSRSQTFPKQLKPFNTTDIKILLLENVNETGKRILSEQGYQVESFKTSLPEDQLIEKIR